MDDAFLTSADADGKPPVPVATTRDELAVEQETSRKLPELGPQPVLGRDHRAEAVPLELEETTPNRRAGSRSARASGGAAAERAEGTSARLVCAGRVRGYFRPDALMAHLTLVTRPPAPATPSERLQRIRHDSKRWTQRGLDSRSSRNGRTSPWCVEVRSQSEMSSRSDTTRTTEVALSRT